MQYGLREDNSSGQLFLRKWQRLWHAHAVQSLHQVLTSKDFSSRELQEPRTGATSTSVAKRYPGFEINAEVESKWAAKGLDGRLVVNRKRRNDCKALFACSAYELFGLFQHGSHRRRHHGSNMRPRQHESKDCTVPFYKTCNVIEACVCCLKSKPTLVLNWR